jgi:hypothetical protein
MHPSMRRASSSTLPSHKAAPTISRMIPTNSRLASRRSPGVSGLSSGARRRGGHLATRLLDCGPELRQRRGRLSAKDFH